MAQALPRRSSSSDIEGAPGDAAVDRALEELRFHCNSVRLLGTYMQTRERG